MSNLLIIGEESGKLDAVLAETASSYERDTDEAMRIMASLLEPLIPFGKSPGFNPGISSRREGAPDFSPGCSTDFSNGFNCRFYCCGNVFADI